MVLFCLLAVAAALGTYFLWPRSECTVSLGVVECCPYFAPVEACATWSVDPTKGASINPDTGVLTVDAETPSGSVFTVSADVENGRRVVSIDLPICPNGGFVVSFL